MEYKKIVYNNMQYNILASIKLGSTTFLICLDILDKKVEYFKQEIVDGKVKLTSKDKMLLSANEVNQKSLSNKKRVLDLFIDKLENNLAKTVFVDRNKVVNEFNKLITEIDNCDLKYYMIENASIEPTDESVKRVIDKFNVMDLSKNLEEVKEVKNELYYFNTNKEEVKPKEESVSNASRIEIASTNDDENEQYNGPSFANDPFKTGNINVDQITDSLNQTAVIENVLSDNLKQIMPAKPVVETKKKKLSPISTVLIIMALGALAASMYFTFFNNNKNNYSTAEIMQKANNEADIKEIDDGFNYNEPSKISSSYSEALLSKLIDANIDNLKSLNSNTVGWIKNDYLKINYPLVKGTDNDYYQYHDYLDGDSLYGWLYVDSSNNLDNIERNTVIFGSSDLNSQLFYYLKNVLQADFVKDINNQIIKLSTDEVNSSWLVFSIYEMPNEDYYKTISFASDDEFMDFLSNIKERSIHDFGLELNSNDRILTLSTDKDSDTEIVVHAKLIKTDISLEKDIDNEKGAATKEEEKIELEKGAATKEDEIKDGN